MKHQLLAAALAFAFSANSANAQEERRFNVGTNERGSIFFAITSTLHQVLSEGTPIRFVQKPFASTTHVLPRLQTGEIDFAIGPSLEHGLAYRGPSFKIAGRNDFHHTSNLRLVMRGAPLRVSLIVRKDSAIKTMADVKGKRVSGEYKDQLSVWYLMLSHLASGGLTFDDVKVVPVPAVNDGLIALINDKVDVTSHAVDSPKAKEADRAVGIRMLSMDCSPEGTDRVRKAVPGLDVTKVAKGSATGALEDACVLNYDLYLATHKNMDEKAVALVTKTLYERAEKLGAAMPALKGWTRERGVDPAVVIPYHPGAIQYYKEKGLWTPAMEEAQKKLLALNP